MSPSSVRDAKAAMKITLVSSLVLLSCCSTTLTYSANPSRANPEQWADYDSLPVELHGGVPGHDNAALSSLFAAPPPRQLASLDGLPISNGGRHIVIYINASALPAPPELCRESDAFQPGTQRGRRAAVTGALCDGGALITTASGYVLSAGQSSTQMRRNLRIITDQLYLSLFQGANNPMRYFN